MEVSAISLLMDFKIPKISIHHSRLKTKSKTTICFNNVKLINNKILCPLSNLLIKFKTNSLKINKTNCYNSIHK